MGGWSNECSDLPCCQMGGLAPLHFACGLHVEEGVHITRMLLDSLADASVRANEDDSYLNHALVKLLLQHKYVNLLNVKCIVYCLNDKYVL